MIPATQSYHRLRNEQQRILDFLVLICHAIPNLKKTIKGFDENIEHFEVPQPDYFKKSDNEVLRKIAADYKKNIAKYVLISSFSFFESYFISVTKELILFHGNSSNFKYNSQSRHKELMANQVAEIIQHKRKLQEIIKKKNIKKYQKHIRYLNSNPSYIRPSELFGSFGIEYISQLILPERFKSYLIPRILKDGFLMDLSEKVNKHSDLKNKDLQQTFKILRDLRNDIAHGKSTSLSLDKTMDFIRFLRHLSKKIDKHLVEHFFILENADYNI